MISWPAVRLRGDAHFAHVASFRATRRRFRRRDVHDLRPRSGVRADHAGDAGRDHADRFERVREPRRDFGKRAPRGVGDQAEFAAEIIARDLQRDDAVDRERDGRRGDADPRRDHAQATLVAFATQRKARTDAMAREEAARRIEEFAGAARDHRFGSELLRADLDAPRERLGHRRQGHHFHVAGLHRPQVLIG